MTQRPPDTPAEEPDGGNLQDWLRGGPKQVNQTGLINNNGSGQEEQNICSTLSLLCERYGMHTAFYLPDVARDCKVTYSEFFRGVCAGAAWLRQTGVKAGHRILICLDNSVDTMIVAFACMYLDATPAIVGTRLKISEIEHMISDVGPTIIVTISKYRALIEGASVSIREVKVISCQLGGEDSCSAGERLPTIEILCSTTFQHEQLEIADPKHPALILYTSGTTAHPKGVVISHSHMVWAGESNARALGIGVEDVALVFCPLWHVMGLSYQVLASLFAGGGIVLRRMFDPTLFWKDANEFGCTWTAVLPYVCFALRGVEVPQSHTFRFWAFPCRYEDVEAVFRVPTVGWWGMTELFAIGCITENGTSKGTNLSVGRPVAGYEVRLTDATAGEGPLANAQSGELQIAGVRGQTLFVEYLNNKEDTAAAFSNDGWYRTGDRFCEAPSGELIFQVREKDIIKTGGENIAAAEIERAAYESGVVDESAAVGKQNTVFSEVPVIFVILKDEWRAQQARARQIIMAACRQKLSDFKMPREIIVLDEFPRSGLGKISKQKLREFLHAKQPISSEQSGGPPPSV